MKGIFKSKSRDYTASGIYPGYPELKSLAIVFPGEMKDSVVSFARELEMDGKQVALLLYLPVNRREIDKEPDVPFICKNDLRWGRLKGEAATEFKEREYDVLIDVLGGAKHPLDTLVKSIRAHFKIGRLVRDLPVYNLTLDASKTEGPQGLFKEIFYYLKFINKEK